MPQTDLNVANATGAAVRADINAHLDAIATLSSGATAPAVTFSNMWWADTSTNILKRRNNANTAWVSVMSLLTGLIVGTDVQAYDIATTKNDQANTFTKTQTWAKGSDVPSAINITLNDGNYFDVTGTTTIATIGAKGIGTVVKLHFDSALTLTHSANLDFTGINGGSDYSVTAGEDLEFVEYAAGDWRCTNVSLGADTAPGPDVIYITTSGSWVVPAGWNEIWVEVNGAGGEGANYNTAGNSGGNSSFVYGGDTLIGNGGIGGINRNTNSVINHGGATGGSVNIVGLGSPGGLPSGIASGFHYTGGSNGGRAMKKIDVSGGGSATVTIGAGGSGASANGADGVDGYIRILRIS